MPIRYELTNDVGEEHADRVQWFMTERHLPDAFATGCFTSITWEQAGPGRFRGVFTAATRDDLDRYFSEHAPRLRDDAAAHVGDLPPPSREEWVVLNEWS